MNSSSRKAWHVFVLTAVSAVCISCGDGTALTSTSTGDPGASLPAGQTEPSSISEFPPGDLDSGSRLSEEEAIEIAFRGFAKFGVDDRSKATHLTARMLPYAEALRTVRDTVEADRRIAQDRPIWVVRVEGDFRLPQHPGVKTPVTEGWAISWIDAVTGFVISTGVS